MKHRLQYQQHTEWPCRSKPSERRGPWAGRRSARRQRRPHRTKRSDAPWRSAPDCSLTSCVLGTGTCIDSALFLMLAPWPIGDKRTCRSDLCNNAGQTRMLGVSIVLALAIASLFTNFFSSQSVPWYATVVAFAFWAQRLVYCGATTLLRAFILRNQRALEFTREHIVVKETPGADAEAPFLKTPEGRT